MRTSKPKIALKIIAVLIAAALVNTGLVLALEPYGSKSQVIWSDYVATVERGESLDTVLIGTSLIEQGVDIAAFDAALGSSSYNMGSPSQTIEESLLALKTACEDFDIKRVILGVSISEMNRSKPSNPASPFIRERSRAVGWAETAATIAGQLFRPEVLASKESLNCLFPWVENHVDPNVSSIKQNLQMRFTDMPVAEAAHIQDPSWTYVGRGFAVCDMLYNPDTDPGFEFTKEFIESDDGIPDENRVNTLREICAYCADNGIELIAVSVPIPVNSIEYYGDGYFRQHDAIEDLLSEYQVPFYDFNLAKPELFDPEPDYFADRSHLNGKGAAAFGTTLGTFLANPTDPDDENAFYTESEYWDSLEGISTLLVDAQTAEGGTLAKCLGLTGPKDADRIEYRMLLRDEDGAWQCVRDWDTEGDYLYERTEHGTFEIRVEARLASEDGTSTAAEDEFERYRELTLYY